MVTPVLLCSLCKDSNSLLFDGKTVYCSRCGSTFTINAKKNGIFSRSKYTSEEQHPPDPDYIASLIEKSNQVRQNQYSIYNLKSTISSLEKDNNSLKDIVTSLKKEKEILEGKVVVLESSLNDKEASNNILSAKNSQLSSQNEEYEKLNRLLTATISQIRGENESLNNKIFDLSSTLTDYIDYRKQNESLISKNNQLSHDLEEAVNSSDFFESAFKDMEIKYQNAAKSIHELKMINGSLTVQLNDIKDDYKVLKNKKLIDEEAIVSLKRENDSLSKKIEDEIGKQFAGDHLDYSVLQTRFREYKLSVKDYILEANNEITQLRKKNNELEALMDHSQQGNHSFFLREIMPIYTNLKNLLEINVDYANQLKDSISCYDRRLVDFRNGILDYELYSFLIKLMMNLKK